MLKFCGLCGAKFTQKSKNLFVCSSCGFHFFINPATYNAVILENAKGEILLTKRKFAPFKGYWDLPGGFIDLGETAEESVVRELKEELGIILKDFKYFSSCHDHYFFKGLTRETLGLIFTAKIQDEKLTPKDDILEAKFFPKYKIPWKRLAFRTVKTVLKECLHV